jgi:hypothetical protein
MCYQTRRSSYFSHPRRLSSNWKPVLVYGGDRHFNDIVSCELADSGASYNQKLWMHHLIEGAAYLSL